MTEHRRHGHPPSQQPAPPKGKGHQSRPPTTATHSNATNNQPTPPPDYLLSFKDGRLLPTRTRLVGGPQAGRVDLWFTLAPEQVPDGWVFPRRVLTPEGEVLVEDYYGRRPGQVADYGREVVYDFLRTRPADQG